MKSTFYNEAETKAKLVDFILGTEILSMNEQCVKFEKVFAEKQQRKHAIFVSSGSSANLLLIQALLNLGRLKRGDKVGVSALTWATNIMPIIQLGLVPVAIDCELDTLNISPKKLEEHVADLDALFLTNVLGFTDDIAGIRELCEANDVIFFEDNCESLGSKVGGKLLGNFGIASTFSFFVGHHISTIEGGMICTDDDELYNALLMTRAHGWDRNLPESKQKELRALYQCDDFYAKYVFYDLAYNARPTELSGFVGNLQIKFWDEIVEKREKNFKLFMSVVEKNEAFIPLKLDHMDLVSNFSMTVVCMDFKSADLYKSKFINADIEIRPIIAGDMTKQPFYRKYIGGAEKCKNADFVHRNGFYFANNPELTSDELELLCSLLEK